MIRSSLLYIVALLALTGCEEADEPLFAVGQLESDRVELIAEFAEPIIERHVVEGQAVAAGESILSQDARRAAARVAEQEARLAEARARLAELIRGPRKEQIEAARARVEVARRDLEFRGRDYDRARQIFERDLGSEEEIDRARTAMETASATLDAESAALSELLTGTTVEELDQASARVQQAEASLAALQVDLERHESVAPVDAIVDSLLFETGERPQPGQPVAILLAGAQPYARAYVPENLRALVQPGSAATVYVDGIGTPLEGTVRWVASEAAFTPYFALTRYDRGRLTYAAKVDIRYGDGRLPDGVPVEVEFR